MLDRAIYALVGGVIGSIAGYALRYWFVVPAFLETCLAFAGGFGMLAWAQRSKRVKNPEELNRPMSLFDNHERH